MMRCPPFFREPEVIPVDTTVLERVTTLLPRGTSPVMVEGENVEILTLPNGQQLEIRERRVEKEDLLRMQQESLELLNRRLAMLGREPVCHKGSS